VLGGQRVGLNLIRYGVGALWLANAAVAMAQDAPAEAEPLTLPPPGTPPASDRSSLDFGPAFDRDSALVTTARRSAATRGVTVLDRDRPAYDPVGVQLRGFRIDAAASLRTGIDTNVYRLADGTTDLFGQGQLMASARSQWARHSFSVDGDVEHRRFLTESVRNVTTYGLHAQGAIDVSREVNISGQFSRDHEALDQLSVDDVGAVLQPVTYDNTAAGLRGRYSAGRILVSVNGNYANVNYEDSATLNGVVQSLRDRDHESYSAGAEFGYNFPAGTRAFVSASHEWRRYRMESNPGRDTNVLELLAGLESEITPLLLGRVAVGYLTSEFSDPAVAGRSGLAIDTRLEYLVTQLTTLNLRARRTMRALALSNSPGALVTQFRLGADHELLRNVIVSTGVLYETADYLESSQGADVYGADLSAQMSINRRYRASLSFDYRTRKSENFGFSSNYSAFIAAIGVTASL